MEDKRIDDIIAMLDDFMSNDGGHMDIKVNGSEDIETKNTSSKTVRVSKSLDCMSGDLACKVPTLFEGLDNDEN